jgi:hypothetical protein
MVMGSERFNPNGDNERWQMHEGKAPSESRELGESETCT